MSEGIDKVFTAPVRDSLAGPVVEPSGDLDLDAVPTLRSALHQAMSRRPVPPMLVVDLAQVTFCDTSGLDALLAARVEAEGRGISLHLARPSRQVARLLATVGADRLLPADGGAPAEVPRARAS
ncbi:STAS domain-containing protein [Kitasatospora sp. NBC_01539]|uniref:STAS domain-containing protein n=1 Tax=Kitasatospora sp. NBC_01539 TaxID=2903577 RepID=UPI00386009AE